MSSLVHGRSSNVEELIDRAYNLRRARERIAYYESKLADDADLTIAVGDLNALIWAMTVVPCPENYSVDQYTAAQAIMAAQDRRQRDSVRPRPGRSLEPGEPESRSDPATDTTGEY